MEKEIKREERSFTINIKPKEKQWYQFQKIWTSHKYFQYYNGYFETLQCFSGDATVQTPDQIKRIDELQVGDQVLSIEESLVS